MRKLISVLTVLALTLVGVTAPVVTTPVASAEAVAPEFTQIPLAGVDRAALRDPSVLARVSAHPVEPDADSLAASPLPFAAEAPGPDGEIAAKEIAALSAMERTEAFMAAGVTWDGASEQEVTEVAVRIFEADAWGPWTELEIESSGVDGERGGTQPLLALEATGIQARVQTVTGRTPADLRIDLVDPGHSAADGRSAPAPIATAHGATGNEIKPKVLTRKQWGADESRAKPWPDLSAKLNAVYVHHTAGTNSYTKAQSAALVRGIYAFHTGARGWPDIGYQFLVDKYGTIYQGRVDAIDDLPVGAQAGGYNTSTIGVSAMGNYDVVAPGSKVLSAIEQVVAWKAYQYGLDPKAKATLITGSSTGSSVKAPAGSTIVVPAVLGHRDTNSTACPGRYLYAKLPTIRKNAAKMVTTATTKHGKITASIAAPKPVAPSAEQFPAQADGTTKYSWKPVAGAVSYQLLTRSANHGSAMPDDRGWYLFASVRGTTASVWINPGQTRYIAVRAIDATGRRGPEAYLTQTTRPVSASAVVWAKKWKAKSGKGRVNETLRSVQKQGATLRVDNVRGAKRIVVFGESGPGFGATEVLHNNKVVGRMDWNSSGIDVRAQREVVLPSSVSGSVRLRTESNSIVSISALAFPRTAPKPAQNVEPKISAPVLNKNRSTVFPVRLSEPVTLSWKPVAGAASYRVEVRTARHGAATFSSRKTLANTTKTKVSMKLPAGQTWYVSVRAIDSKGKFSARAVFPKMTRPVSKDSMVRSTGNTNWATVHKSGYVGGSAYSTKTKHARIKVYKARDVRTIQVVAATSPKYGRFAVYVGKKRVGIFSTADRNRKIARFTVKVPKQSGTVTVKTLDSRKRVRISAITTAR